MLAKLLRLRTAGVLLCFFLQPFFAAPAGKSGVLFSVRNSKYHLSCVFHGYTVEIPSSKPEYAVEYIDLVDEQTGESLQFHSTNSETLTAGRSYYKEVWSPDSEWLVLPLGRFEGYRIVRASTALNEIQRKGPGDYLRIELDDGIGLIHEFSGWDAPASFYFQASVEGSRWNYRFDIATHSLHPLGEQGVGLALITPKNKIPVPPSSNSSLPPAQPAPTQKPKPYYEAPNSKYHLLCLFEDWRLDLSSGATVAWVKHMTILDQLTKKSAGFTPLDPSGLEQPRFLYTAVWSPNMEWLVLPIGSKDGFRIVSARNAVEELQHQEPADFVRIETADGTRLENFAITWAGPESFEFESKLATSPWGRKYRFDLADHSLHRLPLPSDSDIDKSEKDSNVFLVTPKGTTPIPR